jgi:hypothetical protein
MFFPLLNKAAGDVQNHTALFIAVLFNDPNEQRVMWLVRTYHLSAIKTDKGYDDCPSPPGFFKGHGVIAEFLIGSEIYNPELRFKGYVADVRHINGFAVDI